jgi:hypothetical protein
MLMGGGAILSVWRPKGNESRAIKGRRLSRKYVKIEDMEEDDHGDDMRRLGDGNETKRRVELMIRKQNERVGVVVRRNANLPTSYHSSPCLLQFTNLSMEHGQCQ